MRELSNNEISFVSGAGILGTVNGVIGGVIGGAVDGLYSFITGKTPAAPLKTPATQIGQGLGNIFDSILNPSGFDPAIQQLFSGVTGLVSSITTNVKNIFAPAS